MDVASGPTKFTLKGLTVLTDKVHKQEPQQRKLIHFHTTIPTEVQWNLDYPDPG